MICDLIATKMTSQVLNSSIDYRSSAWVQFEHLCRDHVARKSWTRSFLCSLRARPHPWTGEMLLKSRVKAYLERKWVDLATEICRVPGGSYDNTFRSIKHLSSHRQDLVFALEYRSACYRVIETPVLVAAIVARNTRKLLMKKRIRSRNHNAGYCVWITSP